MKPGARVGAGATAETITASPWLNFTYNIALKDFMLVALILLVICVVIMVAATFIFPEPFKAGAKTLVWENWREPLRGEVGGRGLGDYRVLAGLILAVFITLYLLFR